MAEEKNIEISNDAIQRAVLDSVRALMLIRAYRIRGHLAADLDPLGMRDTSEAKESLDCLLYTSPSPRDKRQSRMPSSA